MLKWLLMGAICQELMIFTITPSIRGVNEISSGKESMPGALGLYFARSSLSIYHLIVNSSVPMQERRTSAGQRAPSRDAGLEVNSAEEAPKTRIAQTYIHIGLYVCRYDNM